MTLLEISQALDQQILFLSAQGLDVTELCSANACIIGWHNKQEALSKEHKDESV